MSRRNASSAADGLRGLVRPASKAGDVRSSAQKCKTLSATRFGPGRNEHLRERGFQADVVVCAAVLVDAQRARLNLDAILGERGRSASQTGDRKKQIFQDMKEFRRYLQRLEEWLAITGRPRYYRIGHSEKDLGPNPTQVTFL
ncbi:unnamed protein product [Mesocestoides corti]|uniref:Uncharacterized protein n=1 Tax=Mesocestoides corti TaxID=53468 RepID=A0A0R3U1Z5_MESCO|nr:unnamed protein product [Mesocestoides corti]